MEVAVAVEEVGERLGPREARERSTGGPACRSYGDGPFSVVRLVPSRSRVRVSSVLVLVT